MMIMTTTMTKSVISVLDSELYFGDESVEQVIKYSDGYEIAKLNGGAYHVYTFDEENEFETLERAEAELLNFLSANGIEAIIK